MYFTLKTFLEQASANFILLLVSILTIGCIIVNGWTDAPNAIATCISTRCLKPQTAIILSAIFNCIGIIVMCYINSSVAQTVFNIVDFGNNSTDAIIALSAGLFSIIIWSTLAWFFSIPTSESHGLIAGITGACIALHNNLSGINYFEWAKVLYGLIMSTVIGFAAGFVAIKLIRIFFRRISIKISSIIFKFLQILSAIFMSFLHGAQDGQKFIAVFLLSLSLSINNASSVSFVIPFWVMILASIAMGLGTAIGGLKIIKAVGMDMVKLHTHEGFAADLAGIFCLMSSSLSGIPVSTTHTKTTAIMGVGFYKNPKKVNWKIAKDMVYAWILTFPCCGIIAYLVTKFILFIL